MAKSACPSGVQTFFTSSSSFSTLTKDIHHSLNISINLNSKIDSFVCNDTHQGLYTRSRVSG